MVNILTNNYPERMYRTVIYPAGMIFYGIWSIAQYFLDPVTKEKVKPCYYLTNVEEFIDPSYIPVAMGGKCEYEFNPNDYVDPYPEEAIAALEKK